MFNHEKEESSHESRKVEFAEQANETMEVGTKVVFTAGSIFCIMKYLDKLSESCKFLQVFGPFWHYFDALGCFVSAYYEWQTGAKVQSILDLAMGLTLTIAATIEFFVFPFLAAWGFALCMWQLYTESVVECYNEPSAEKIVNCLAYLCAAAGTTLLAIAETFPPSAPMVLPVAVVLCLCAGIVKAGQLLWAAGKQLYANKHGFFSQSTEIEETMIELQPLKTQTDCGDEYTESDSLHNPAQNDNSIEVGEEISQSLPVVAQQEEPKVMNDNNYIASSSGNDHTFENVMNEENLKAAMSVFRISGG